MTNSHQVINPENKITKVEHLILRKENQSLKTVGSEVKAYILSPCYKTCVYRKHSGIILGWLEQYQQTECPG